MNPTHIPIRVATGAYILNSGISKLGADEGTAQFLHGAAAGTYPSVFKDMKPKTFAQVLAYSEIAVGGALLLPKVSSTVAGAALTGFGASLLGMYLKTPSMTLDDGIRPSPDGIGVAKGDDALVEYFNTQLTDGGEIWQQIFDNNLGASGVKATQPEVDPVG